MSQGPLVRGALSADTCRVGMAVQVTSSRAELASALEAVGWGSTMSVRADSLGMRGLVMNVEHSSTQDRIAILEMADGRNEDVLAMPKAALHEIPLAQLGPIPRGWEKTADGLWRHGYSGKTRRLRPMHRGEDPAAVRREFAERDRREDYRGPDRRDDDRDVAVSSSDKDPSGSF